MNKRWFYVSLIVNVSLLFCLLFWIWSRDPSDEWNLGREENDPDYDRKAHIERIITEAKELASSTDTVAFYGKFIDQHGDPVEGVKVYIKLEKDNDQVIEELNAGKSVDYISFTKETNIVRHSDEAGLLNVKERGISLYIKNKESIFSFHRDGYIGPIGAASSYESRSSDPPDSDQPVIFYMWKRSSDPPSRLIKRRKSYSFKPDGNWHGYDPITGDKIASDDPRADLILSARIEQQGEDPDVYDWQLTLKMSKGGIQRLASFPYRFLAPEDGYRKTIIRKGKSKDRRKYWGSFYLRSYEGRVYASVYIEAEFKRKRPKLELRPTEDGHEYFRKDPEDGGHPYVEIYYSWLINPFGSRKLEYDPYRYEKLKKQRESGELKLSTEEFWKLVNDEDPVRSFGKKKLKAIVELLQKGETPKAKDYQ